MAIRRRTSDLVDPGLRNILDDVRNQIISGALNPGVRLPAVRELAATYGVAGTTIHRCLQELTVAGFLSTHGRNGTRVVDFPPHRHRFGLVLPRLPLADGSYLERHWQAKAVAAQVISTQSPRKFEIFHGINSHPELPQHVSLLAAIAERRLAGLIILDEKLIVDWLVPASLSIPVVGVNLVKGRPWVGNLLLELEVLLDHALAAVARQGLRRTAVLFDVGSHRQIPKTQARAGALGLDLPHRHIQCLPTNGPEWATQAIAGLFDCPASQQPEALILTDEISIPAVESALDERGIGSIFQVHLANFPLPSISRRPALRLGWDHRRFLLRAMEMMDAWHANKHPIGSEFLPLE